MKNHIFKTGDVVRVKFNFKHKGPFIKEMNKTINVLGFVSGFYEDDCVAVSFTSRISKSPYYFYHSSLEFIESVFKPFILEPEHERT